MTPIIIKFVTGEEIIGDLDDESVMELAQSKIIEIQDPMWIETNMGGSMHLRSATALADTDSLVFNTNTIVSVYYPSKALVGYYKVAAKFDKEYTQEVIDTQILKATEELSESAESFQAKFMSSSAVH